MCSPLCSKGTETLKAEREVDELVTQSGGKSHPLNYISAQEKSCRQSGNERRWAGKDIKKQSW